MNVSDRQRLWWWPLLVLIAGLGLVARLWNIDFDQRQHLHPDERHWALTSDAMRTAPAPAPHGTLLGPVLDWLDGQRSAANAYRGTDSFLYGPVSLATARAAAGWLHDGVVHRDQPANAVAHALNAVGIPLIADDGSPRFDDGYNVDLIGRLQGAVFDTFTIVVVGLIARRLAGRVAALAAAAMYAASVLAIQHAHFLGSEPLLGLACALTVLCTLQMDRSADLRRSGRSGVITGLAAGAAVAAKLTGVGLAAVPVVACVVLVIRHRRRSDVVRLIAVVAGAAVAFRVLNPGAFDGLGISLSKSFRNDLRLASTLNDVDTPPAVQWASRVPLLQPLYWLGMFTIGPGVVLAAGGGAVALFRRRRLLGLWTWTVPLAAVLVPFGYVVATALPSGRYFVPMSPALHAVAGVGVAALIQRAVRARGWIRGGAVVLVVLSTGLALLWGAAFVNGIYGHTNTRITASHWLADNAAAGSVVSVEAWDDGLPLRLPNLDTSRFTGVQFDLFGPDGPDKMKHFADQLTQVDYVVESSPRVWASVVRIPARFPSTIRFFDALDSGALGFSRVATFTSHPRLGFFDLDDSTAEEAFSVYDHPEVRIWKRVHTVPTANLIAVLDPLAAAVALPVRPQDAHANGLLLHADEVAANAHAPTYNETFDVGGSPFLHALGWFVLLELFGFAAFVIMLPLLRRLPDAGLGLGKTIGLAIVAFAIFVIGSWTNVTLSRALVALLITVFFAIALWRGWRTRRQLVAVYRERRAMLIVAELLGVVAFVAFLLLRASDPDLWHPTLGGEKPFELTLLTAVLRSRTFPVYDPWYSGGSLNYYYGGWLLLSGPARLLRTAPAVVMNLGIAVFASCVAGASFSAGSAAAHAVRPRWRSGSRGSRTAMRAGVLSTIFVLVLSNVAIVPALWRHLIVSTDARLDWWTVSRVIPASAAITEFPAWSMLFGDLHPHVMGIALTITLGALCIAWNRIVRDGSTMHAVALGALVGMMIGFVRATNTWDFPLALAMATVAILAALARRAPWKRCVAGTLSAMVLLVAWEPYTWRGLVFDGGVEPTISQTPLHSWFEQFSLFMVISVVVLAIRSVPVVRRSPVLWGRITTAHVSAAGVAFVVAGWITLSPHRAVMILSLVLAAAWFVVAWTTWRSPNSSRSPLGPLVLGAAWLVQTGVEVWSVTNDAGRMNTVFKFWYESWILLAVGSAVVLAEEMRHRRGMRWGRRLAVGLTAVALVLAVTFWVAATPVRLDDRLSTDGLSLNGESYRAVNVPMNYGPGPFDIRDDSPLIDWLRAHAVGVRPIAEAPGIDYRWSSQFSVATGLPTPIGWGYHESQRRRTYAASIDTRKTDMTTLYQTVSPTEMARVLATYSIAYVVFGTQEQLVSTPESANALRHFPCLIVQFTSPSRGVADALWVASVDASCVNRLAASG